MRRAAWLALLPLLFLALFYFYPLGSIFALSFEGGWLAPLSKLLSDSGIHRVVGFTFWQAALSTALTLAIGLPAAHLLARYEFPGKRLLRVASSIPFVLPTLVVAAAFNAVLGPRGWLNQTLLAAGGAPLEFINTFTAILVAHIFYNTTIVLRMVSDFWSRLSPRIEQAASTLGASGWRVFTTVTLPMLAPALAAAALLVFIFNFTSFGVVLVLGGPQFATIETEIYYQTVALFNLPAAALLALLQLLCTLALTIVYTRLSARLSRPVEQRAPRLRPLRAQHSAWLSAAFLAALTVFFIAPLGGLAARSVTRLETDRRQQAGPPGFTLDYYRALGDDPRNNIFFASPARAIQTSLVYAGATVALALLTGVPASWLLAQQERTRLARWLDPLLMLPLGTSALTLGLGFIVALDTPPLDLRASPILVPLAHTLVALPFVVRSLVPALRSIRPRLRQAAAMLGATPRQVLLAIDVPLVGRAILAAALFAFAISVGEFGATALIARPEYPTMPVLIYRLLAQPGALTYGQAMALSTLLMLFTGGGMLLIERLRIADVGEF
ncbi:MAG TPA: iron ABC transporter permease [Anaerolineales bacterium]|nr:iron ABC transporter permease [Anaerolineales bacterium]HRQ92435.1 iron ABC transporter permease [Anaerolineales bacterium]